MQPSSAIMSAMTPFARARFWTLVSSLLFVACGAASHAERPTRSESTNPASPAPVARDSAGLYAADEALRDALSGPWEYLGTGPWPGINRMHACAFRNARVLVVNVYCTLMDARAIRFDVYSPQRGRVRIYAEANGPVSSFSRRDYFTFTAESEPPPALSAPLPPVSLSMSFEQLRAYDEQRYHAFLPACYGGQEHLRERAGCLGPLAPREKEWTERNRAFLSNASNDWYRMVREMRALASRHGREPE